MDSIVTYFNGEKIQCIVGLLISLACISVSIYFLFLQNSFLKGIAYPFLPLSAFLLIICGLVIARTPQDLERVTTYQRLEPQKIQTEELPRMQQVMNNFGIIKKVEIGIVAIGLLLAVSFWRNDLVRGVAVGLVIQGSILLLFDHLAESRGEIYIKFLESFP